MLNFKVQQAILKYLHKKGNVGYCDAISQQLKLSNKDGEIVIEQGQEGYWFLFGKNVYRIDENDIYINLEKINQIEDDKKIREIENIFEGSEKLMPLDEPKICIKEENTTYVMFLYGKDKFFVEEKDLKVLENNYKDYEYKLCIIEEDMYILALSIKRELVAIFMDNKLEEVELIGGKYEENKVDRFYI